jgi:hypothetical protein
MQNTQRKHPTEFTATQATAMLIAMQIGGIVIQQAASPIILARTSSNQLMLRARIGPKFQARPWASNSFTALYMHTIIEYTHSRMWWQSGGFSLKSIW